MLKLLAFVGLMVLIGYSEASGAQFTLSWIDNSNGVAAFSVERRLESDTMFAAIGSVPPGVTSYVDAFVVEGSTYCYRVVAYDDDGVSPYSNEACSGFLSGLSVTYDGKLRDRVGQNALAADGALDGTLTATLSASGGRTVTALTLQSTGPGTWSTDAGSGFWVLGVATDLDAVPLMNDLATMAVNFAVPDGGTFVLFASDYAGIEFVPGATLTLTAAFSDGTTAIAITQVPYTAAMEATPSGDVGPGAVALATSPRTAAKAKLARSRHRVSFAGAKSRARGLGVAPRHAARSRSPGRKFAR